MSIQKPTAEELAEWEKILSAEGHSMRRGQQKKLVFGHHDLVRRGEATWDQAVSYVKQKRKTSTRVSHVCIACGVSFMGRTDAKTCRDRCRKRLSRKVTHNSYVYEKGASNV